MTKQKETRAKLIANQRAWIEKCGGSLSGYVAKYGEFRGPEVYRADAEALRQLEEADVDARVRGIKAATIKDGPAMLSDLFNKRG